MCYSCWRVDQPICVWCQAPRNTSSRESSAPEQAQPSQSSSISIPAAAEATFPRTESLTPVAAIPGAAATAIVATDQAAAAAETLAAAAATAARAAGAVAPVGKAALETR